MLAEILQPPGAVGFAQAPLTLKNLDAAIRSMNAAAVMFAPAPAALAAPIATVKIEEPPPPPTRFSYVEID